MAFDTNYVSPFIVLMTSVFINNKNRKLHIHVILSEATAAQKGQLEKFIKRSGGTITFYEVSPALLYGLKAPKDSHITIATFYRLFLPQLVPASVEKLLYLDPDIITLADLSGLYNTPMNGFALAAVPEINQAWVRSDLGFTKKEDYFNAGVMLINVKEWINQKITERAVVYARNNHDTIVWADQDALNGVVFGNFLKLPARFNVLHFDVPEDLSRKAYERFLSDKIIVHFTNVKHKPWSKTTKSRLRYVYMYYLSRSPRWPERFLLDFKYYTVRLRRNFRRRLTKRAIISTAL